MKQQTSTKGFAILSAASFIVKVLSFAYLFIQSALVHDAGNSVITAGFWLYAFIYALTNAGLNNIISKFVSERVELGDYKGSRIVLRSAFTLMMGFGIAAFLFTYFGSGFLADLCSMPQSKLMFMYISPTFLFSSISCSLRGYFQGRHNMTPTAVAQILEQVINSILTIVFEIVYYNYALSHGLDTLTYTAVGSALATVLAAVGSALFLLFLFFVRYGKQRHREYKRQTYGGPRIGGISVYSRILKFSIPALISCIAAYAPNLIDLKSGISLLMAGGYSYSDALAIFGIYNTKFLKLLTLPTMFAAPLVTAIMPSLAAAMARKDPKAFRHQIRESYKLNYAVVIPIVSGLTFLAVPIVTLIFFSQNAGGQMVALWSWTAVFITVQTIQTGLLTAINRPGVAPVTMLVGMLPKLICNYVLIPIPSININGAIIGNTLAYVTAIVLNQFCLNAAMRKKLKTWRYVILPALASVVMGVCCLGLDKLLLSLMRHFLGAIAASDIALLIAVPFGAAVYFSILIVCGGITSGDIQRLPMGNRLNSLLMKVPFLRRALTGNG